LRKETGICGHVCSCAFGLRPVLDTSRSLFYAHLTLVHLEDGSERLTAAVEKDHGARKLHAIELGVVGQVGGCLGDGVRQFER
jgi:hypothetical protein